MQWLFFFFFLGENKQLLYLCAAPLPHFCVFWNGTSSLKSKTDFFVFHIVLCLWAFFVAFWLFLRPSSRFLVQGLVDKNVCVAVKSHCFFFSFFFFCSGFFFLCNLSNTSLVGKLNGASLGKATHPAASSDDPLDYFYFHFFLEHVVD